eukprot:TRINITY_DN9533_c0_g1_i1.p1 TRINITY_DN9533_c0_g1~~TRINITY_DN9533_c0_g1_i1.p1  ORF type:complete len:452 (+),score=115.97 TRINITY_DN9533_c0_g1_i1:78-1433(+)
MATFSPDAYNTKICEGDGAGTLIGNWFEERALRDSSGEGRTVPQRHLPRSGLLKDWTKVPAMPRKGDNTFDRVYGPQTVGVVEPASKTIGKADDSVPTHMRSGPLTEMLKVAQHEAAENEVHYEEGITDEINHARYFETSTGIAHQKPDYTVAEKATHGTKSCATEIMRGQPPDRMLGLDNEGLEVPFHAHYSGVEQVTHQRMCLADPEQRNNVQNSAASGIGAFHRNGNFTKGCDTFALGCHKDEAMVEMFEGLKETNPLRHLGGETAPGIFSDVPSLAALKAHLHRKVEEVWGFNGYILLRQRLFDFSDHEGFIQKSDIVAVIREQLGVSEEELPSKPLDVWLSQLVTMKKDELKVASFLSSLRPALPQKDKRKILTAFKLLQPPNGNGMIRLGDWLARLDNDDVKRTVISAFGAEDEDSVANTAVTEQVFLEVFSDLAALTDIAPLLA